MDSIGGYVDMYSQSLFCHSIFSGPERKPIAVENFTHAPTQPKNLFNLSSSDATFKDILKTEQQEIQEDINDHTPTRKKAKQQKCNICGKVLSSASSYYVHLKKHSNNKPYHCNMCNAAFCRKPYLEVHMRTHTGERPFECDVCKKRFTQKSSLNTHKRSHSGLRPYACEICLKRFSVKSYLAAHQWSHAASNGVSCNICHLTFNSKGQYIHHLKSHNANGFECEYCPRYFAKESYLIRHKNRVHYVP